MRPKTGRYHDARWWRLWARSGQNGFLARVKAAVDLTLAKINAGLGRAAVIGCDETAGLLAGQKYWQAYSAAPRCCCTRWGPDGGKALAREIRDAQVPDDAVSGRYAVHTSLGESRQLCLAQLIQAAQYTIDASASCWPHGFRFLTAETCQAPIF